MLFVCHSKNFSFSWELKWPKGETEYNEFWGDKQRALQCVMVFCGVVNDTQNL